MYSIAVTFIKPKKAALIKAAFLEKEKKMKKLIFSMLN
jgi:hypothetical protein